VTAGLRAAVPIAALAALAGAAALWLARPADACGCGVAIEATVNQESALVIEEPGREQIVLSLDLASDGDQRAAVVLPVPGVPTVDAIEHGDPLAYLDQATQPPPSVGSAGGGETAPAPRVDVIDRETIGGYDVARLGAGDAGALNRWLNENGYTLPAGAEPILDDYVAQGWHFVAIRLAPQTDGRLKPLEVSFPADQYVYPMKLEQLATVPLDLTLFTLADGPRQVAGLETIWDGSVDELSPPPPPTLGEIFGQGGYVTRLEATGADPAQFTADLQIEPTAAASTPAPAAVATAPPTEGDDGISTEALIAIIAAGLAFALGLVLLTRPRRG
jgi:hypothetical protein